MTIADQLKEMGFDAIKVEMAMRETGGSSLEQAMEWILAHNEDEKRQQPGPSSNLKTESAGPGVYMATCELIVEHRSHWAHQ